MKLLRFALLAVSSLLAAPFGATPANAVNVTPIHIEMNSAGSGSRAQVTVTNPSRAPLPIEIAAKSMELDERGKQSFGKAAEEFLVFPPQALIQPGATQTFRLQWVGEPQLPKSRSFMIYVNQIPVKMPKGQSGVQVVMSFGVQVNVAPPRGIAKLSLVGTGIDTDPKSGKRRPTITVSNSSNTHGLLPDAAVRVSGGGWSHAFTRQELDEKVGIGLVQPGKRRRFILPVDLPAGVTKVEATLDYRPKRR